MMNSKLLSSKILDSFATLLAFSIVLFFGYVYLFKLPYLGFNFSNSNNAITDIYIKGSKDDALQVEDKILELGNLDWKTYADRKVVKMGDFNPGENIPLTIRRGQQDLEINWRLPGFNLAEFRSRLDTLPLLLVSLLFIVAGAITVWFIRPTDELSRLLAAFFFLTAIWIATGTVSAINLYYGSDLFHTALWLSWPVFWQLNWMFPKPLKPIPAPAWGLLYLIAILMAVVDALRLFPMNAYPIPIVLSACGALVLQFLHLIYQPEQRRQILQFILLVGIALLPGLIFTFATIQFQDTTSVGFLTIIPLGLLPLAYLYPIYHHQLGKLELRTNQVITALMYSILLIAFSAVLILVYTQFAGMQYISVVVVTLIVLLVGLIAPSFYARFRQWSETRLLGMPIPPTNLLTTFAGRIVTSIDTERLAQIFVKEILPSLLIRQAAMVRVDETGTRARHGPITSIYTLNVPAEFLPSMEDIPALLARSGQYYPPPEHPESFACPWARLVLPLKIEQRLIGLCLFGRRDPDDYYAPTELSSLQALMDQTALALVNIDQAQQLRALYRQDIEREEQERSRMALDLHDDVLNQMTLLAHTIDPSQASPQFSAAYQASVQHIRKIITGLRPQLLNFGLKTALDGLVDDILPVKSQNLAVSLDLPSSTLRYPEEVELHLYRIVQQACQNAIQHGQAQQIRIYGSLQATQVELTVEDDGVGFDAHLGRDLTWLLENQQFGLAGMYERAALINATLQLDSTLGSGTRVKVVWQDQRQTEE